MPVGMILEALVAVLLIVTVVYCAILDRRLKALRSGQDGLRAIIEGLDSATSRAQASVGELRGAADAAGGALAAQVSRARALGDELQIMLEAGNALADRLEGGRAAQSQAQAQSAARETVAPRPKPQAPRPKEPEEWEDNLLKALREAR